METHDTWKQNRSKDHVAKLPDVELERRGHHLPDTKLVHHSSRRIAILPRSPKLGASVGLAHVRILTVPVSNHGVQLRQRRIDLGGIAIRQREHQPGGVLEGPVGVLPPHTAHPFAVRVVLRPPEVVRGGPVQRVPDVRAARAPVVVAAHGHPERDVDALSAGNLRVGEAVVGTDQAVRGITLVGVVGVSVDGVVRGRSGVVVGEGLDGVRERSGEAESDDGADQDGQVPSWCRKSW
jgi:hypothetical protein